MPADDISLDFSSDVSAATAAARDSFAAITMMLHNLPISALNKGGRFATRAAAKIVLDDAKTLAPIDTGALEKSLKVRARKRSRKNKGTVAHRVITGTELFAGDQFYGAFHELGTSKLPADPFIRPALWSNKNPILQQFIKSFREWLDNDAVNVPRTKKLAEGDFASFGSFLDETLE